MSALEKFPRITPFLWFDSNAEEAVEFYLTVFKNSRRLEEMPKGDHIPGPKVGVLTIAFELDGQTFTALNGGPHFKLNEASRLWCVATRRERPGMRWTEQMADAIVQLRAIHLSGDFDQYWQFHIEQDQRRLFHTEAA
jgi:predicted 3-demethylubiquinone-9 3-methyltransferase (glyoxalase superfamily)